MPIFFILAILTSLGQIAYKKNWQGPYVAEVLLSNFFFFCMGLASLVAAYAHVFMGPETARMIGWAPGSPFQYEIGIANLSYGVLGVLAYWIRGRFWDAAAIGWSILLLGCFIGHIQDYYAFGNDAPYNIGVYIWLNDLALPIIMLSLLAYLRISEKQR